MAANPKKGSCLDLFRLGELILYGAAGLATVFWMVEPSRRARARGSTCSTEAAHVSGDLGLH